MSKQKSGNTQLNRLKKEAGHIANTIGYKKRLIASLQVELNHENDPEKQREIKSNILTLNREIKFLKNRQMIIASEIENFENDPNPDSSQRQF